MIEAFKAARAANKLMEVGAQQGEAGGFEAFILQLLAHLKELDMGETLEIMRTQHELVVVKRQVLTATKASLIDDVDFRMEGQ